MTATLPAEPPARSARAHRIPVAVLGATGSVGQRFVQLLEHHPWFRLHEVIASERSAGKSYGDAADWQLDTLLPRAAAALGVKPLGSALESRLVFSGLDSSVAGEAEEQYANRGCVVVSNSKNHRMDPDVPLLLPEINSDHLAAIEHQRKRRRGGYIVTNSNCSTMGLALAIAPIERLAGIEQLFVTTMQAISGAGYNGVASYAILDNVIPYISGEEEKVESEPQKILGRWDGQRFGSRRRSRRGGWCADTEGTTQNAHWRHPAVCILDLPFCIRDAARGAPVIVTKFGGSSVGDAQRVADAFGIVAVRRQRDPIV